METNITRDQAEKLAQYWPERFIFDSYDSVSIGTFDVMFGAPCRLIHDSEDPRAIRRDIILYASAWLLEQMRERYSVLCLESDPRFGDEFNWLASHVMNLEIAYWTWASIITLAIEWKEKFGEVRNG